MLIIKIKPKGGNYYRVLLYIDELEIIDTEVHTDVDLSMEESIEVIWKALSESRGKIIENYDLLTLKTDPARGEVSHS